MNEKRKAEEEEKQMADLSSVTPAEAAKKPESTAKSSSKDINFGAAPMRFTGGVHATAAEFPSMEEADKIKTTPKKFERKQETKEKKEPEIEPAAGLPRFTNTKKKTDAPTFAQLEPSREFQIAGQEKERVKEKMPVEEPKETAPAYSGYYYSGKKKQQTETKKVAEVQKEKEKEKVVAKSGSSVATFSAEAPTGVRNK